MLPINEEQSSSIPAPPTITQTTYDELVPASFLPMIKLPPRKRQRLCRRGRYLNRALQSLKSSSNNKPRLCRRPHYFERIVGDLKRSVTGSEKASNDDTLLRLLMFASLACSIRDTYDTEILHRGSSRRNSRRASSCRRESNAMSSFETGILEFKAKKEAESLNSFQSRCAEGRRRLSVMSMVVADKVSSAMRTDLARGVAYAMVPCASALAFFMFNYAKRYNNNANSNE